MPGPASVTGGFRIAAPPRRRAAAAGRRVRDGRQPFRLCAADARAREAAEACSHRERQSMRPSLARGAAGRAGTARAGADC